jgi:hypothetical protein
MSMLELNPNNKHGPGAPMNRNELRKADINLMVVFEALMQERNLTRAAESCSSPSPRSAPRWPGCVRCSTTRCWFEWATAWSPRPGPKR